jgi:hypothetical protein
VHKHLDDPEGLEESGTKHGENFMRWNVAWKAQDPWACIVKGCSGACMHVDIDLVQHEKSGHNANVAERGFGLKVELAWN